MRKFLKSWNNVAVVAVAASAMVALGVGMNARAAGQAGYSVQKFDGGTISGKVLWVGKPVHPQKIGVTVNRSACGNMKEIYPVQVEQGGVVDAVVWLDNATHGKAFDYPKAILDQKGCMFVPPVVLMGPGKLEVLNSDKVTHNVHIYARFNRESNHMMAPGSSPVELTLMRPETIKVACDIHSWMKGYIVVAKNPYYAVTTAGGAFTLTDVPPGTYQIKVWQPKFGIRTEQVTVQADKTSAVTFKVGS